MENRQKPSNMPIDRYIQGIKFAATIFQEFADRTRG